MFIEFTATKMTAIDVCQCANLVIPVNYCKKA